MAPLVAPPGVAGDGAGVGCVVVVVATVVLTVVVMVVVVEAVVGDVVETTPPDGVSDRGTPKEKGVIHAVG